MPPSNPLAVRSSNPVLNASTFGNRSVAGAGAGAMTIDGTVNKTALSLLILLITATYTWSLGSQLSPDGHPNLGAVAPWTMVAS